ncbi:MAG: nucleoside deaminase [Planctomycetes bacterium]|nr:nucleoside deaminase [Planctomycetota bacterium]
MYDYNQIIEYMQIALGEAQEAANEGEVPVGAVIIHQEKIVGRGRNACERLQDATAHAEMLAITAASETIGSWRLEECDMFVTLEPCPMCVGASLNSRLRSIYYGAREPKAGACGSLINLGELETYNHRLQIEGGILADESSQLLKSFFKTLRTRKKYEN